MTWAFVAFPRNGVVFIRAIPSIWDLDHEMVLCTKYNCWYSKNRRLPVLRQLHPLDSHTKHLAFRELA